MSSRRTRLGSLAWTALLLLALASGVRGQPVVAWGSNGYGQVVPPEGLSGVIAVAAGRFHSLALKSDGTVVGWGDNSTGHATPPAGLSGVVAIAAGEHHSLALKSDGTVVGWGSNFYGQLSIPAGLSGVTAIAAGFFHSLAFKADGTVVGWGYNAYGQASPPTGAGMYGIVAIAAGGNHSLALKSNGTVVGWGWDYYHQEFPPIGLSGVTAIAAGGIHSLALKADGTVVGWGDNTYGQLNVPAGLSGVKAIAAGTYHSLALTSDGTVVGWGRNNYGQLYIPAELSGVKAIAAGEAHSLALVEEEVIVEEGLTLSPAGAELELPVGTQHTVTATAQDANGAPLVGREITFQVLQGPDAGVSGVGLTDENGQTAFTFTGQAAGTDVIQASFMDSRGTPVYSNNATVRWVANQPPVAEAGPNQAVAIAHDGNPDTATASVLLDGSSSSDPEGGALTYAWKEGEQALSTELKPMLELPAGTHTITLMVTDPQGNQGSDTVTVTVQEEANGKPTANPGSDRTVEATGPQTEVMLDGTASLDPDQDPLTYSWSEGGSVLATGPTATVWLGVGAHAITLTVTDPYQLSDSKPVVLTVGDSIAPVITGVPEDVTVDATDASGAVVNYAMPRAMDRVDGEVPVQASPPSGSTFPLGETLVGFTATDRAGNTASAFFKVTVRDAAPPVISGVPQDMTVEATGPSGAEVTYTMPTAYDAVDGALNVTASLPSGSTFPIGATEVTFTASDRAGNQAQASFKVTVGDTTAPTITGVPADMTVEASGPSGAVVTYTMPTARDLVDGDVTVTADVPSGSTFPLGETTVTFTATDRAGNTAHASFKVTVKDATPPVFSGVPQDMTVGATGASGAVVTYTMPTAYDAVDGDVTVTADVPSGSTFPVGSTTVTFTAKDRAGNSATASFRVTVGDTTAPTLSGVPADMTVEAVSASGNVITYMMPTAYDTVDGSLTVTASVPSGSTFPLGATTVSFTATDSAGNSATASFVVRVAYGWSGFLSPIDANGSSVFKLGSTVPVKFQLTGASAGIANAVARLGYAKVSDGVAGDVNEAESNVAVTEGNLFRYDATSGIYIFNWSTKGLSTGTYELQIDLGDGVPRTVRIGLK